MANPVAESRDLLFLSGVGLPAKASCQGTASAVPQEPELLIPPRMGGTLADTTPLGPTEIPPERAWRGFRAPPGHVPRIISSQRRKGVW